MARKNWSREELIIAFNLYCKIPFGRMHNKNPDVIALAEILGRTPSAVAWKLVNFARLDPTLGKRGIKGASHGSKQEIEVWDEFHRDWENLSYASEVLLAEIHNKTIDELVTDDVSNIPQGEERERTVKVRVNQFFFRSSILAAYSSKCCITGLDIPELLNASHIIPWSIDVENRVNPQNGLCLNAIHDRAFDRGLLTVGTDYRVKVSPILKSHKADTAINDLILRYEGERIK